MKKLFLIFAAVLLTATLWAQSPEKISYQAVVRDNVGNLVMEQEVGLRISILQYSETGTEVYKEIYNPNPITNINGLLSLEIGSGVVIIGNFSEIDWSDGPYFLKTETDPTGGTNYTITGTSQLLSVPYALHAQTAQTVVEYSETDPTVPQHVKDIESGNIDNWNEAYGWGDHSEVGYLTDYTVTEEDVITHQEALEITENQITDLQDYYLATNPDGFISDYTVTEEDVTAHQEALEITESQITDFGNYIETETDPLFSAWDKDYEDLTNKPDLAPVAISGSYNDLTDKPQGSAVGEMQYWDGSEWVTVPAGNEGQILAFVNGIPTWSKPAIPTLGLTDVYSHSTGKVWMDRNLGASQVATSSTDEDSYGDLYQWGRAADGHQIRTSGITSTLSNSDTPGHVDFILAPNSPHDWRTPPNDNLWQGVNGINNPCPPGYRLPTEAEWEAERQSWSSNNSPGAFASPLKLPVAGYRSYSNGSLSSVGSFGYYWSSTVVGAVSRRLAFDSGNADMFSGSRADGSSVRCIKD